MSEPAPTVFISYAHEDETWKDRLVGQLGVLELEGELDVWEDREIAAGDDWQERIEQAIDRARVAVLLITANFLTSEFIRGQEVPRILARRKSEGLRVVPLIVRPCPWQAVRWLGKIQARPNDGRPLSAGREHQIEVDLADLALEIRDLLGGKRPAEEERAPAAEQALVPGTPGEKEEPRRRPWHPALWLIVTLVLVLGVWALVSWRLPTRIQAELSTRRVALTLGGDQPREILSASVAFSSLVIEGCESLAFTPARLAVADPQRSSWQDLPPEGRVRLACRDPAARLTLQSPATEVESQGTLDRIWVEPGTQVVLEAYGGRELEVTIDVEPAEPLAIPIRGELELVTEFVELEDAPAPFPGDYQAYRVELAESDRMLELESRPGGMALIVTPTGKAAEFFREGSSLPLDEIELLDETLTGELVTPLRAEGVLSYPDHPDCDAAPEVTVDREDFVALSKLESFGIQSLRLDPETSAFVLRLDGVVGRARVGGGAFSKDVRLTPYHWLVCNWRLQAMAVVIAAVLGWLLWGVKAVNKLRKLSGRG